MHHQNLWFKRHKHVLLCKFNYSISGSIHSPNYPNPYDSNDDCSWSLEVDPNHRIQFSFVDFDVEPHSNCSYDYVALYDGENSEAPEILKHCGQSPPVPNIIYSTGNKMYIRMKADGSVTSKGFLANYTRACGANIVTSSTGKSNLFIMAKTFSAFTRPYCLHSIKNLFGKVLL